MNIQCQIFSINVGDADKMIIAASSDVCRSKFGNAITAQFHVVKRCRNESKTNVTKQVLKISFFHYFIASTEIQQLIVTYFNYFMGHERRLS